MPSSAWGATGAPLVTQREHAVAEPRWDEVERLGRRVQGASALQIRVEDGEVDVPGTPFVGDLGDGAGQRLLARLGADGDDLIGLDVGAEADDQLGE